jgi:hypothetical protein
MLGIGYDFFVLLAWSWVGPVAWGFLSAWNWKRCRTLARFAAVVSGASIVVPLAATIASSASALAAAMVVAVASLPIFLLTVVASQIMRFSSRRVSQAKANSPELIDDAR